MPSSDYTPAVSDVALFLRTRTRDTNGAELGTFTSATRPTDTEVLALIADAVVNVADDIGPDIDTRLWASAKRIAALKAAMAVEVSYYTEQVASGRSVYPQLKEWYEEDLDKLNIAIVETAEGGEVGTDAGEDTPVWGGGDVPFIDGLSPSGVDLSRGSIWPEALTAFHNSGENPNEDAMRFVLGNPTDAASTTPQTGTIASYLRKIRDLLSTTLDVNIVSSQAGAGGLTDTELRATPVPVSGPVTNTQLRATPVPVSHSGLTDAQLRAAAVPVDPGSGPFSIVAGALPLPNGAATETTLADLLSTSGHPSDAAWASGNGTIIALLKKIASTAASTALTDIQLRATPVPVDPGVVHVIIDSGGGGGGSGLTNTELRASAVPVSVAALPLPAGAATETSVALSATALGAPADAAATTTGSVIAQLRRVANLLAGTLTVGGTVAVSGTVPVSGPLTDAQLRASKVPVDASGVTLTVASHAVDTELPAAAALSDTDANPTAPQVGSALQAWTGSVWVRLKAGIGDGASATGFLNIVGMMFNGTTYDRMRGTTANGLSVDVSRVQGNVAITAASLPLPAGAATETTLGSVLTGVGAPADAAATTTGSIIAQLRRIANLLAGTLTTAISGSVAVTGTFWQATQPVSGTFWQATQPVSLATQPLPTGASTETTLGSVLTGVGAPADAAATTTGSIIAQLRRIANQLAATLTADISDRAGRLLGAIYSANLEVPFTTTTVQAVGSTDAAAYSSVSVHIVTQGTGSTVAFQGSNDNVNWVPIAMTRPDGSGGTAQTTTLASITLAAVLQHRYFRLNVTGISAGTTAGTIEFSSIPRTPVITRAVLTDGTTAAKVAAASTAAVATDPAIVVAVSPNNTVPVDVTDRAARLLGIVDKGKIWDGTNIAAVKAASTLPTFADPALVVTQNPGPPRFKASTFRTPGLAGTAGQKLASIHNATGSTKIVRVKNIKVSHTATVVTAVTVLPPLIRIWKVTVLPTNGNVMTKVAADSAAAASNASITVLQGASADGTASTTALTATLPGGTIIEEAFASRIVVAGEESGYLQEFLTNTEITLNALEGIVVFLDYVLATQNATTDMWTASIEWSEV